MTTIYFVRHAEPNYNNHDDMTRELTAKGWADRKRVTEFLKDKNITKLYSSPYKRAVDTIGDFAEVSGLEIATDYDFRERKVGDGWIDDFDTFAQKQWEDFSYKLEHGESLGEVQERAVAALNKILDVCDNENVAVGIHGTALSVLVHYVDAFSYAEFCRIVDVMPWIVEMKFDGKQFVQWKEHPLP